VERLVHNTLLQFILLLLFSKVVKHSNATTETYEEFIKGTKQK